MAFDFTASDKECACAYETDRKEKERDGFGKSNNILIE